MDARCCDDSEQNQKSTVFRMGLLLLGSLSIAYNLDTFFHEISHSAAAWMTGGWVGGIYLHPFSWSYSYSVSPNPIFHAAAGALGACCIGLFLFVLLIRWTRDWLLPLLLVGPIAFLSGGNYWLVDMVFHSGGDACSMIDDGVSRTLIAVSGVLMLVGGIGLAIVLIKKIGFFRLPIKNRLIVGSLGTIPSTVCEVTWQWIYNRPEIMLWLTYAAVEIVFVVLFSVLPLKFKSTQPFKIRWKTVIFLNILAVVIVIALLATAGMSQPSRPYDSQTYGSPPEGFPEFLTPHPLAEDVNYIVVRDSSYALTYDLPHEMERDEIVQHCMNVYGDQGYHLFQYNFLDPNEIAINESSGNPSRDDEPAPTLSLFWVKIDEALSLGNLRIVDCTWENHERVHFIWATVSNQVSPKRICEYMAFHPNEFDPNEVQRVNELYLESQDTE